MKTYYIVEYINFLGQKGWSAHTGILARLGCLGIESKVPGSTSVISADDCERGLRVLLAAEQVPAKVVRVLKI